MSSSLQEQLIKMGLATEKQARKAADEQRREIKRNTGPSEAQKRAAEQAKAQAAKAARDAELNRQRQEKVDRKARAAQVKQLIEQHRLPKAAESDERFNFMDGRKVRFIRVDAAQRDGLNRDELAIVRCEGRYDLVPVAAAALIGEREPRAVIAHKVAPANTPESPGPDDPYKEFVVPDDLTW